MKKLLLISALCVLASCSMKPPSEHKEYAALIDLVDSTHLMRELTSRGKIGELLEKRDPETINILLDNFSPASMAIEAEVFSSTIPLVVVCYYDNSAEEQELLRKLDHLALAYEDRVKFVIIDSTKLFSLAQDAGIERNPTILIVKERSVIDQLEDGVTIDAIKEMLAKLI